YVMLPTDARSLMGFPQFTCVSLCLLIQSNSPSVIAGLVPAISLRGAVCPPKRDARVKPAHDEGRGSGSITTFPLRRDAFADACVGLDHVGALLSDHDRRGVGVAGDQV